MENLAKFFKSFGCAFRGLKYVLKNEQNFQLEIVVGVFVTMLMYIFDIRDWQKVVLFLVIFSVLVIELINTIVERMIDILKPRVHPYAQLVKDVMAAVVLITSIGAVIVGFIIFWPYFRDMFFA